MSGFLDARNSSDTARLTVGSSTVPYGASAGVTGMPSAWVRGVSDSAVNQKSPSPSAVVGPMMWNRAVSDPMTTVPSQSAAAGQDEGPPDYEALLGIHMDNFACTLKTAMDGVMQSYKSDLKLLLDEILCLQPEPTSAFASQYKKQRSSVKSVVRGKDKIACPVMDDDKSPRSHISSSSPTKFIKIRPQVATGYVPLQLWNESVGITNFGAAETSQRIGFDVLPAALPSAASHAMYAPRHEDKTASETSESRDLATASRPRDPYTLTFAPASVSLVHMEDSAAVASASLPASQITSSTNSRRFWQKFGKWPSQLEDDMPVRNIKSMTALKGVSGRIIQQHRQEMAVTQHPSAVSVPIGADEAMAAKGSTHGPRRRSINMEEMRGYVRKQKRKAFYLDPEDRNRSNLRDMVFDVLLRPEEGKTGGDTPLLDLTMSLIVVLNTIVIGISTDVERKWWGWSVFDVFFALCYLGEFMLKMWFGGCRRFFCGKDVPMNMFDLVLLVLAWVEVFFVLVFGNRSRASVLRLFRLVRITKVLRVCRLGMFADLLMMINGAIGSFKTLLYSVFLITIPLYVVSLFFHELLSEYADEELGAEEFESLSLTIFNIFRCIIAGECTNREGKPIFLRIVESYGWWYGLIYCFTVTFMTFGLFNVIVAIYVENIVTAAKFTARRSKRKRLLDKEYFQDKCLDLLRLIHEVEIRQSREDHSEREDVSNLRITPELLEALFAREEFTHILHALDIADEDMIDMFETLDVNANGEVDMEELIVGLARLRGEFRRSDIIGVSLLCRAMQEQIAELDMKLQILQTRQNMSNQVMRNVISTTASQRAKQSAVAVGATAAMMAQLPEDVSHIEV